MSKPKDLSYFEGKWWCRDGIWENIGNSVTSRPTEQQALSNINLQTKYIRKLSKWDLTLTEQEILVYKTDRLINSIDFDIDKYREKFKVYNKDLPVVKISKITGYSEQYTRRLLANISYKVYLSDVLGIVLDINNISSTNNKDNKKYKDLSGNKYINNKRNSYYKKIGKYKKKNTR